MTVTATAQLASQVLDFGFVRASDLEGGEDALASGVCHALRLAGFEVEDGATSGRGAVVVAAGLTEVAGWLERIDAPVVLVPIVRAADEAPQWLQAARSAHSVWSGSPGLAEVLQGGGLRAHHVGLACQFGQVRHHARAAYGVRDEDYVFGVHPTVAVSAAELEVVRGAMRTFFSAAATRFSKASVLVSAANASDLEPWRDLANELRCDAIVTAQRPRSGLSFAGLVALADCELVCGAGAGLVPWSAAAALFAGRPTLSFGGLEPRPFGADEPARLQRIEARAEELSAAMARLIDEAAGARDSRSMVATNSARAVTVAIVEALRADGMWHSEGGT